MNIFLNIMIFAILIIVFIYTVSYGYWTWKNDNKPGGFMVFILALTVIIFPIYVIYFRFA